MEAAFQENLAQVIADMEKTPGMKEARKISITVEVKPQLIRDPESNEVHQHPLINWSMKLKVPDQRGLAVGGVVRGDGPGCPQIFVNMDNPTEDDPDQPTLFDVEREEKARREGKGEG